MDPIYYPGTVQAFRAVIDRLTPRGEWLSLHGENVMCCEVEWQTLIRRSPHYACWALRSYSEGRKDHTRCAAMVATYSPHESRTKVVFLDGRDPIRSLIEPWRMEGVLVDFYLAVMREIACTMNYLPTRAEVQAAGWSPAPAGAQAAATEKSGVSKRRGRQPYTAQQWQEKYSQVKEVLQKAEASGIPEKTACELMGIPYSTFKGWKARMLQGTNKGQEKTKND